jgi:hypothetical protein
MDRLQYYRKMHALLREIGIENSKPFLLEGYGVEHTKDLPDKDLMHLVDRLVKMKEEKMDHQNADKKHWRSVVLSILNKYGVYVTNNNWDDVNRLLLDPRVGGKIMYEMSKEELQAAAIRLRVILSKREEIQEIEKELSEQN